ncbi:MAG: bifunctional phosphopantothenoylcysteine decarboxylase/phosphopantothenate--cysteine ligase CoaBC [Gammaproteobacteria bacterium]|nr:MAG: bifunctional phosphopantothenoylcysteine decarboxylase/phosphopantothenate--cysteine ligase CoaBC [Gammaproteobacteria bacterium]
MASLINKRVLVGITGGIAAYKSADLVRRLREAGAEVRVVMTRTAEDFITPLTLQTVSGHPVYRQLVSEDSETGMDHIALARWADVVLVAPATANFIAKLAQGRADDLLSTLCLAMQAPVAVAPAMNQQMWDNAATQANIETLCARGIALWGPGTGDQACGETGEGRMLEPLELLAHTEKVFATGVLNGLKVMVTAGPTWEAIDPVRGLTNKSSGKMGYAVAMAAAEAGAEVTLISGPTALPDPDRIRSQRVSSAADMHQAVLANVEGQDIFIAVAAVADYRPASVATQKIKKDSERLTLELVRNPDILACVAALDAAPYTVGFAAETKNLEAYARDKLKNKKIDMIVANAIGQAGTGFDTDNNELTIIDHQETIHLPRQSKHRLARTLIHHIAKRVYANRTSQNTRRARR